jgi:hypothetical protein
VVRPFARSEHEVAAYLGGLKVRAEDFIRIRSTAAETLGELILQRRGPTYKEAVTVLADLDMRMPRHQ